MPQLLLADTFFPSVAELSPKEQAQVVEFVTLFQKNPAHPGISLERLGKSPHLWSGRITQDLRSIVHKEGDAWALLYADHHDAAYRWGERRTVERHPVTGALQIVESVETVREVERVLTVMVQPEAPTLFASSPDAYLLSLGVPETWLPVVRQVRNEDHLFIVCEKLSPDVAERLLALAAGDFVTPPPPVPTTLPVTESPDTRRRFYVVEDDAALLAALEAPLDRWIAFLHPSQRAIVEAEFRGPAKVTGSAGTGKTVVAMHRARHLARHGQRVLLTSFVTTLCRNIGLHLEKLCTADERRLITVSTIHKQALAVVRHADPGIRPASDGEIRSLLESLRFRYPTGFDAAAVRSEWENVIQLQGIGTWPEYRSARRTGRGRPLSVSDRKGLWEVFEAVHDGLRNRGMLDWPGICRRASELLLSGEAASPFDAVVVDEVQDLKPPELRFLSALCSANPGGLMVVGDTGQRIYPGGFSLSALGIEVRGRSRILRLNYRTTEQIRRVADRMLGYETDDMDGGTESRKGTRSLLRGPRPVLKGFADHAAELSHVAEQVRQWVSGGLEPSAIGVFTGTNRGAASIREALERAGVSCHLLADEAADGHPGVNIGTMHRAKGLEFQSVFVVGCSAEALPNPRALAGLDDPQDREGAEARERRLLYVAMTRARDELHVTWSGEPSCFLKDLVSSTSEVF